MTQKKVHKHPFTVEEDQALMNYVRMFGSSNWVQISMLMKGRTQKQCRERWNGHLSPTINKGPWTLEEDIILAQKHDEIGNKWAKISQFLPGRTDILVKNRWNTSVKNRVQNGDLKFYTEASPVPPVVTQPPENVTQTSTTSTMTGCTDIYNVEKWLEFMSNRHSLSLGLPPLITNYIK